MKKALVALGLLLLPSLALGAGFAKGSLFLSKASVTEGETVLIHAIISNDTATPFEGKLVFLDNKESIGSVPVSLDGQEAQAVSVSWKPSAGSHPVVAELQKDGEAVEKLSATFSVAKKPEPKPIAPGQTAAAVESSAGIQDTIENVSPAVAGVTAPFFRLVDGGRSKAAEILDTQIETTKERLGPSAGTVLGAEETKNAASNPMGAFWYVLQTLYLYILTIVRFLVGNAGVFYPVLAVAFLYFMWRLVKRFRR